MRVKAIVAVAVLVACQPEGDFSSSSQFGSQSAGAQPLDAPALWGTSVVTLSDGRMAVADPDADAVWITRDGQRPLEVQLPAGSRPSRIVEAGPRLAVVLRGSGQLARFDLPSRDLKVDASSLLEGCSEPRGLAAEGSTLVLACAGGELVTIGETERTVVDTGLELRDVMLIGGARWVTTFRDAELVELDAQGQPATRLAPPEVALAGVTFRPRVAWRTIVSGERVVMVHQLHVNDEVTKLTNPGPSQPYYGAPYCVASVVTSALTVFDARQKTVAWSSPLVGALPVDVAAANGRIAVAFAGAAQVLEYTDSTSRYPGYFGCLPPDSTTPGVATGVGYSPAGELVYFDRTGLVRRPGGEDIALGPTVRSLDAARTIFHAQSPSGVACASCHPEGHDDGHTWRFGARVVRSQALEGGLLATAPFHWDGRFKSLSAVLDETLVTRMGGTKPDLSGQSALGAWLDAMPARTPAPMTLRAKIGGLAFRRAGCESCHAGPQLTNGATVDVGTGGKFQVPSLKGLRWRGPWMHDGCAKTLGERFDPACGGSSHGGPVPVEDVPDLVEYLQTL